MINGGRVLYLASDLTEKNLMTTMFGRELRMILGQGCSLCGSFLMPPGL